MEPFTLFDTDQHLQAEFKQQDFDLLHNWDLGWALLEPIDIANSPEHEAELSKRFSPGQKALYFFWYLDGQVTNGGFIQFYYNNYRLYVPVIKQGLELVGDTAMLNLIDKAEQQYMNNEAEFLRAQKADNIRVLYSTLTGFEALDDAYYQIHDNTMLLIEKYARSYPAEFIKLLP